MSVVEHAVGVGGVVVLLFVDDLDATLSRIAERGLQPDEIEAPTDGVRKAVYRDPDGNEFCFGGTR